jgi:hypothetical protein
VYGNTPTVSPGKCGIMLIDQGRDDQARTHGGPIYKTRNNAVHGNEMTFEGAACAGGASDIKPGHENFSIITATTSLTETSIVFRERAGPRASRGGMRLSIGTGCGERAWSRTASW